MKKGRQKSTVNANGVHRRKKKVDQTNVYDGYSNINSCNVSEERSESRDDEVRSISELSVSDPKDGATGGSGAADALAGAQTTDNPSEASATVIQNGKPKYLKDRRHSASSCASSSDAKAVVNTSVVDHKIMLFFDSIREGSVQKVRALVKGRNMNMNTRDYNDALAPTALIVACETDNVEIVRLLMTAKKARLLDVNQENKIGRRPIWIAALKGNAEMAELLMNTRGAECDVNFTDKETGTSPLYRAILSNSPAVVRLLIEAKADVNMRKMGKAGDLKAETPLIKAVQLDNQEIVEQLVNALCKIQARTEDGFTALHYAVAYRRYDIAEYLLKNNIKIHAKSNNGITAMTVAIEHHNPAMVKLLIEYGYKMDKRYKWKETPLSQAINLHSEECAMTIIQQGCSLEKKRGNSYFYMAVDEKMMRLTKFMAAVNPQYLQQEFIKEKKWPVSIYRRPDIIEWLERESTKVRTLRQLCRGKIFRLIGKYPPHKIKTLNLPDKMKQYLSYSSHVKDEFFTQNPLNLKGECPVDCPAICSRKYCPPIEFSSSSESENSIDDDDIEAPPTNSKQCHDHETEEEKARCGCCK